MAWIMNSLPEYDITSCSEYNPEVILMRMQGDEQCDVCESQWMAGTHVTPPRNSRDTE